MLDAVEAVGQPSAHVVAEHLGLDDRPTEVAEGFGTVAGGLLAHAGGELLHHLAVASDEAELAGLALVAHDRHREGPPLPRLADHVLGGHGGAVEDDLPELLGDPVDHA